MSGLPCLFLVEIYSLKPVLSEDDLPDTDAPGSLLQHPTLIMSTLKLARAHRSSLNMEPLNERNRLRNSENCEDYCRANCLVHHPVGQYIMHSRDSLGPTREVSTSFVLVPLRLLCTDGSHCVDKDARRRTT